MNVIFLDIDGPVISTPQYFINPTASYSRSIMNTNALGWIRGIIKATDAKIVTNSSHNYYLANEKTLKEDLIIHGIEEEDFHVDWRTNFYQPFESNDPGIPDDSTTLREKGFLNWLKEHPEVTNYVIFDDLKFTDDPKLIHVRFEEGITFDHYLQALDIFDVKPKGFIV